MKNTLLFLTAAACLTLPALSRAEDLSNTRSNRTAAATANARKAAAATSTSPQRMICYITDSPRTGSQIPMIYREYNGRIDSASNAAVYGSHALRFTGSLDAATTLAKLEPSIQVRSGR